MSNWKRQALDALDLIAFSLGLATVLYTLAVTCASIENFIPGFTPRVPF